MRTRTRTDSTAGQRLDFSWDNDDSHESSSVIFPVNGKTEDDAPAPESQQENTAMNDTSEQPSAPATVPEDATPVIQNAETKMSESTKEEIPADATHSEELPPQAEQEAKPLDQPEPESNQHTPLKKLKSRLSKGTQNTSIVNNEASLGKRLQEYRKAANVSIDDLKKRLSIQSSIIEDLENGDYENLSHSFNNSNAIFLVATIKEICNELGVSKNQTDELVDIYYTEIANTGLPLNDTKPTQIADRTENESEDSSFPVNENEPIIKKLPKILVFLLLIFILIFIFVSIILPYVKVARKPTQQKLDFAPLIAPEKAPPTQLTVP